MAGRQPGVPGRFHGAVRVAASPRRASPPQRSENCRNGPAGSAGGRGREIMADAATATGRLLNRAAQNAGQPASSPLDVWSHSVEGMKEQTSPGTA